MSSNLLSRPHTHSRSLRRVLLASVGALVASLALTAAAQAQSTSIVQLKSSFLRDPVTQSPLVIGLKADFAAVPQPDNDANFRQHWTRTMVSPGTFTFQSRLFSQGGCLKVADTTSPSSFASTVLGSCSSPRAKWRLQFRGGPGELLVNTSGTGHALSPSQCLLGACEHRVTVVPEAFISNFAALIGWSFDTL